MLLSMRMLRLLSIDEILLPRYMNWSANFRRLPFLWWSCYLYSLCCIKRQQYLFIEIYSLCLFTKGSKLAVSGRERERERPVDIKDSDTGILYLAPYLNPRCDPIFRAHLVLCRWDWSGPFLNARPLGPPRVGHKAASALTARFSWLTACPVVVETKCLYNIFSAQVRDSFSLSPCLHKCTSCLRNL